jgi:hypothetical protein
LAYAAASRPNSSVRRKRLGNGRIKYSFAPFDVIAVTAKRH